jgi:hypothetical protein
MRNYRNCTDIAFYFIHYNKIEADVHNTICILKARYAPHIQYNMI